MDTIFSKIDSYKHSFLGFSPVGFLKNSRTWRRYVALLTLTSAFFWILLGWEATWTQPLEFVKHIPYALSGQISVSQLFAESSSFYGLGQHLSSPIIYGVCFILLSVYFEKHNIRKSMNFIFSTLLTLMSVGMYELIYNVLYSNLQLQPWTLTLQPKQGLNIGMFAFFVVMGAVAIVYLYSLKFKLNFNKTTKILLALTCLTYALWIFYPVASSLTVQTTVGAWTSTPLFPQTMYAVDIDPTDAVAVGVPYFVQNDGLHLVNVLNKLFFSLSVLSLVMIRSKTT